MPNHITNWVEFKHENPKVMAKFKKDTFTPELMNEKPGENYQEAKFDFNGIIPMPKILEETVSPVQVVKSASEARRINSEYQSHGFAGTDQKVRAITETESKRRITEYGANNWYDFANRYWGTKWGAYEVKLLHEDDNTLVLEFQTAWSSPYPIFEFLESKGFTVNCKWQDEDPSNEGEYGEPYDVFEINHPQIEVDYVGAPMN